MSLAEHRSALAPLGFLRVAINLGNPVLAQGDARSPAGRHWNWPPHWRNASACRHASAVTTPQPRWSLQPARMAGTWPSWPSIRRAPTASPSVRPTSRSKAPTWCVRTALHGRLTTLTARACASRSGAGGLRPVPQPRTAPRHDRAGRDVGSGDPPVRAAAPGCRRRRAPAACRLGAGTPGPSRPGRPLHRDPAGRGGAGFAPGRSVAGPVRRSGGDQGRPVAGSRVRPCRASGDAGPMTVASSHARRYKRAFSMCRTCSSACACSQSRKARKPR